MCVSFCTEKRERCPDTRENKQNHSQIALRIFDESRLPQTPDLKMLCRKCCCSKRTNIGSLWSPLLAPESENVGRKFFRQYGPNTNLRDHFVRSNGHGQSGANFLNWVSVFSVANDFLFKEDAIEFILNANHHTSISRHALRSQSPCHTHSALDL